MTASYNIPKITVGDLIDRLTDIYALSFDKGVLDCVPSAALWGPMGVGKSTAVKSIASRLSARLGQNVSVTDIRLLNFSPIDLRGIPSADAEREFTVWLKPKIFDLPEDRVNILFLDEISAAPQSLQAAAYQIALDKRIGEHCLPKNCIVICAGNRTTDRSVAFRIPKALANRMMHFEIDADFESWCGWAVENEIDARVLGYLAFDNSKLYVDAGVEDLAFPTPRSWEFVSRILKVTEKSPEELHCLISGCVGVSYASEFEAWCRVYERLPSTADIISGKCRTQVKGTDVIYALSSSLLSCVSRRRDAISCEELENICVYASHFPPDFSALLFKGLLKIDAVALKLTNVPSFSAWLKKNRNYL